jgi:hypothetical protein
VSGQRHAPAALNPQGKDPRYPLYRRLGGPQSRSAFHVSRGAISRTHSRPGSRWVWSASLPCHALPPGKGPLVLIVQEAGWTTAGLDTKAMGKIYVIKLCFFPSAYNNCIIETCLLSLHVSAISSHHQVPEF